MGKGRGRGMGNGGERRMDGEWEVGNGEGG